MGHARYGAVGKDAATASDVRVRRWLPEVLCVIFGVLGALSDVFSELLPSWLVTPLVLVSFVGLAWAVFLKIRNARSAVLIARLLAPTLILVIVATYALLFPTLWFYQDALADRTSLFFEPWPLSEDIVQSYLSPTVEELSIDAGNGVRLQGWLVKNSGEARAPLVIYFGGSGASSNAVVPYARNLEGWSVAVMSYRGFGLSDGAPTHASVLNDALVAYDVVSARPDIDPRRVVAMGYSIGTAVAVHLAAERPLAATILVAPFDTMTLTGVRQPLFTMPLRPVMKRYFDSAARAPGIDTPLLCLLGLRDQDVPPELALRLMGQWGGDTEVKVYPRGDHDLLFQENSSWDDIASYLSSF